MKSWKESIKNTKGGYSYRLKDGDETLISTKNMDEFSKYMEDNYPNALWIPPYGRKRVEYFNSNPDAKRLYMTLTRNGGHSYLYSYHINS